MLNIKMTNHKKYFDKDFECLKCWQKAIDKIEKKIKEGDNKMNDTLVHNFIMDLKKKEVDPIDRAHLIKEFIRERKLSQRSFAYQFGIPKSTVEDWLLWNNIEREEKEKLQGEGISKTEIYRTLRKNKQIKNLTEKDFTDIKLKEISSMISPLIKLKYKSSKTKDLIKEIIDKMNRMMMYYEKLECKAKF